MISLSDWQDGGKRRAWFREQPGDRNRLAAACFAALADSTAPSHPEWRAPVIATVLAYALGTGTHEAMREAKGRHRAAWGIGVPGGDRADMTPELAVHYAGDPDDGYAAAWSSCGSPEAHHAMLRAHARPMATWRVLHRLYPEAMPLALLDIADTEAACVIADIVAQCGEERALADAKTLVGA